MGSSRGEWTTLLRESRLADVGLDTPITLPFEAVAVLRALAVGEAVTDGARRVALEHVRAAVREAIGDY